MCMKIYNIEEWENLIDKHEESFINNFAHNAWILDSVWFNSSHMKVCYIMIEGNHITNTFTLKEFEDWKTNIEILDNRIQL